MTLPLNKPRTTIRMALVTIFIISTTLTAALAIGLQYYFGQSMAREAAQDLYTTAATGMASRLRGMGETSTNVVNLLARNRELLDPGNTSVQLEIFTRVMRDNPLYHGIALGRADGSLYQVVNLQASEEGRAALRALPADRWLVFTVTESEHGRQQRFEYLDENLQLRSSYVESSTYELHTRPWYFQALKSTGASRGATYRFTKLGAPGRTTASRVAGSDTVVAVDVTLSAMSGVLRDFQLSRYGDLYLYQQNGLVVASSNDTTSGSVDLPIPAFELSAGEQRYVDSRPVLKVSNELDWPPFDYSLNGEARGYSVDVLHMIAQMTGLKFEFVNGFSWPELVQGFRNGQIDLLQSVALTGDNAGWGLPGESYTQLPFALATTAPGGALTRLEQLQGRKLAIPQGWSIIPLVRSHYPDIEILETGNTLQALQMVQAGQTDAALDNEIIMRYIARHYYLDDIAYHAITEFEDSATPDKLHILVASDQPQLRALLDRAIQALGEEQRDFLSRSWLAFESDAAVRTAGTVPSKALVDIARDPQRHGQLADTILADAAYLAYAAPTGDPQQETLYLGALASRDSIDGVFLGKVLWSMGITAAFLLLLLPLCWVFAYPIVRPVRLLAVENDKVRRREYDQVAHVESGVKELYELSESMLSMVASIQAHELAQRELMDSFIKLIAQAIDDKSPYTAGHCARVPELALLLVERASASEHPAFAGFCLETEDQWREYRIAAWLHDCGKITTPEHIVDKGSKLEAIYNRIHEVRMRFEVLWRDAEIEYRVQLEQSPHLRDELELGLREQQLRLQNDFAFVAACNVGGEFLDQDKKDRLRQIAATTWQRHFDDRLGLSPVEELSLPQGEFQLPAREYLLSDKPEHIVHRKQSTDYAPELGIDMDVPEHLYNLGEIYNLSVSRGTLTSEDRFKINEHMISTIRMLESLPFPQELQNVPRYASTHHETMRGSGYPRKLPGHELSIPERILAVADVFEALTAADRPYKKAKPVSVAVDILHKMVLDEHIDRDCFELFLRDGVHLEYAQRYLDPSQIDEVDVSRYLQGSTSPSP